MRRSIFGASGSGTPAEVAFLISLRSLFFVARLTLAVPGRSPREPVQDRYRYDSDDEDDAEDHFKIQRSILLSLNLVFLSVVVHHKRQIRKPVIKNLRQGDGSLRQGARLPCEGLLESF
jgi:hypothetical protein